MEWVKVARVDEVPEGTGLEVMAGNHVVALFREGDQIYALDGICPHAGGPLAQGCVAGGIVTCPWHGWQFEIATGQHCLTKTLQHKSFPVELREGEVWVATAPSNP